MGDILLCEGFHVMLFKEFTDENTQASDDLYENILEEIVGSSDLLEHLWIFNTNDASEYEFIVEAHITPDTDGDQYIFSYSFDAFTYINMFTVNETFDKVYSYTLPSDTPNWRYYNVIFLPPRFNIHMVY